jgi:hypothetical protein
MFLAVPNPAAVPTCFVDTDCPPASVCSATTGLCVRARCDVPPRPANGVFSSTSNPVALGEKVVLQCDPGYLVAGSTSRTQVLLCTMPSEGKMTGLVPADGAAKGVGECVRGGYW